ncbi:MAG: carbohydrate ABC transporter permease [Arcanobacterium sp.]|nr:carbohydrate ABC transporter permease [Arcanobacterium sp.]MDY5589913.1 carbohydrate ABC transporter permease [Arcanobacterium sp.]
MLSRIWNAVIWLFILVLLILAVLPFLLMVITSFQHTTQLSFAIRPSKLTLDNFINLFTIQGFGSAMLTSTTVVVIACVLNIIVCSLAAFGFAFKRFPGSEALFWIYLATMMIPTQVTMIPMFMMFRSMGILGSHFALAIPVVNAFGVFLIRQFMYSIPPSLIEAARIDGASDFRIFLTIILPLIRSVLVALTVFTFLTTWNDFLWPLISLTSDHTRTVTLAVSQMAGAFETQYGMVMAGTTVAFLVPFIVYVVLQRQFVEGVTSSGVKG